MKRNMLLIILVVVSVSILCYFATACDTDQHMHQYGAWEIITPSTCTETGFKKHRCPCGAEESEIIEKDEHSIVLDPPVQSNCTTEGLTEGKHCSKCGEIIIPQEKVSALGHYFVDSVCTRCGEIDVIDGMHFVQKNDGTYELVSYSGTAEDVVIVSKIRWAPITSIGDYAFKDCKTLKSITIPDTVTEIGENAFLNCAIETAIIPAMACEYIKNDALHTLRITSGNSLKNAAFKNCNRLKNITIADSVTALYGGNFFEGCPIETATVPAIICPYIKNPQLQKVIINSGEYLDYYALQLCNNLMSVTIPQTIKTIGGYAFDGCNNLKRIDYLGDISSWCEISFTWWNSNPLLYGHNLYIDNELVLNVNIPNNVSGIKERAFEGWNGTSIVIPEGVEEIGEYAFNHCSELKTIVLPNTVKKIGSSVFCSCDSLISITLPDSLLEIGAWAFLDCSADILWDKSPIIEDISSAFWGSKGKTIIIPNSVRTIGPHSFDSCCEVTNMIIPDGVTIIGDCAFEDCSNLETVTIPRSIIEIGGYAFGWCYNLLNVYYKGDVETWCEITFHGSAANPLCYAHNLYMNNDLCVNIEIPDTITKINPYAFYGWNGTSVTLGGAITEIGNYAFFECYRLVELYNKSNLNITLGGLESQDSSFGYLDVYPKVIYNEPYTSKLSIDNDGFILYKDDDDIVLMGCVKSYSILKIPSEVTQIYQHAFYHDNNIISVSIPNKTKEIGRMAFGRCCNIDNIEWGNGLKIIESYAFYECDSLESISFPESLTIISYNAFYNCKKIKEIFVSKSINEIGSSAFSGCDALERIIVSNNNNHFCSEEGVLFNIDKTRLLCYPSGKTNSNYSIPFSVEYIGFNAFEDAISLVSIAIPYGVKTIGDYAFLRCSSLTSISIPNSVTNIGTYAFGDCNCICDITIGCSVEKIGAWAFYGCDSLKNVYYTGDISSWCKISFVSYDNTSNPLSYAHNLFINNELVTEIIIPNTITEIKDNSFAGWNGTSVIIPYGVTSIGKSAFDYCVNLKSVVIPDSVKSIGVNAFCLCSSLVDIAIGNSIDSIGTAAFHGCEKLTKICYTGDIVSWSNIAFIGYDSNPLFYAHNLFMDDKLVTEIIMPEEVTQIKAYSFAGWMGNKITIPESVKIIESYAFYSCEELSLITYQGTISQWDAISKDSNWYYSVDSQEFSYIINCLDGTIEKE